VHLVGFIIRIFHDARSAERQMRTADKLEAKECTVGHISVYMVI